MTLEEDRRDQRGTRVPFEALVVVASQKGSGGAYECEAVDVSERGMHLRTAYLPEIGQSLSFRFDGGGSEVVTEGVVQWRDEQAKGGEFGVKFTRLDGDALAQIRDICGISGEGGVEIDASGAPAGDGAPRESGAQKGSRVRLHIDGLGSPMRARVRDAQSGEVMVGSNLEFLRVGKSLEFEDVERGRKRAAVVDKVSVEVDPGSNVPQLVVTLRYDDSIANGPTSGPPTLVREPSPRSAATIDTKRDGKAAKKGEVTVEVRGEGRGTSGSLDDENTPKVEASGEAGDEGGDEGEAGRGGLAERAKQLAADVGPKLGALTASVKGKISSMIARVRERREERAGERGDSDTDSDNENENDARPRRVTSLPPEGGLHASGRRVVRGGREEPLEQEDDTGIEETDEGAAKLRRKQRAIIAAAAGVLVMLVVVFATRARSAPPGAEAAAASVDALPASATATLPMGNTAGAGAALSGDAVTANVPLFGSTPLSTTEPAQLAAPGVGAQIPAFAAAGKDGEGADQGSSDEGGGEAGEGSTQFGKGTVTKARTVRIKMDAPIAELKGSTSPNGFTIMLPGRRNIESAQVLAKRDKRLSSVKAVAKDGGTEVTFSFKENVPPFLAKANGKMLEIDLGETPKPGADEGSEPTAKKSGKKKHAVAKKDASGADKKKKTAHAGDKKKAKKKKAKKKKAAELAAIAAATRKYFSCLASPSPPLTSCQRGRGRLSGPGGEAGGLPAAAAPARSRAGQARPGGAGPGTGRTAEQDLSAARRGSASGGRTPRSGSCSRPRGRPGRRPARARGRWPRGRRRTRSR
jgi:hypothetical protein